MEFILELLKVPTILAAIVVVVGLIYSHLTGRPLIVIDPGGATANADEGSKDTISDFVTLESIQGEWRMISVGRNGNFAPQNVVEEANVCMRISGNRFEMIDSEEGGTIHLRNNVLPTHMDQRADDGDLHQCIVRFRNDELEICQGEVGKKRPRHFDEMRSDGASLTRFAKT